MITSNTTTPNRTNFKSINVLLKETAQRGTISAKEHVDLMKSGFSVVHHHQPIKTAEKAKAIIYNNFVRITHKDAEKEKQLFEDMNQDIHRNRNSLYQEVFYIPNNK